MITLIGSVGNMIQAKIVVGILDTYSIHILDRDALGPDLSSLL